MIQIQVIVTEKTPTEFSVDINLLSREDVTKFEWELADKLEKHIMDALKKASNKSNTNIDVKWWR